MRHLPDFIDNDAAKGRPTMAEALNALLGEIEVGSPLDVAAGYFNVAGYALVADAIGSVRRFRLLIGKEPRQSNLEEGWRDAGRAAVDLVRLELGRGLPSDETRRTVARLVKFLRRDDVEVRVFRDGFLHGKAYIFDHHAIVGSSNFTHAGLTWNTELNVVERTEHGVKALREWFDGKWAAAREFKADLLRILEDSGYGRDRTPYEVWLKALYEYFRADLEKDPQAAAEAVGRVTKVELAGFQEEGYRQAKRILERWGGVMVADSVGLGKTFVGKRLLEDYAYHLRQAAVVVCPAQLLSMWKGHLRDANIQADVFSQEALGREDLDEEIRRRFREARLVVIDESHNFRNKETRRYENLSLLLEQGGRKRVVLLTATPVNNTIFDLFYQIDLFVRGNRGYFRSIGIDDLYQYFVTARREGSEIFNLLETVVVRRTRKYVRDLAEKNPDAVLLHGKPVRFPKRRPPANVTYSLETTYKGLYERIVAAIERLHLAPYSLEAFRRGADPENRDRQFALGRQTSLVYLMKCLYLKRFESSIEAFRLSIGRQRAFLDAFLEHLGRGRLLDASAYRRLAKEDDTDAAIEMVERLPPADPAAFDMESIRRQVEEDREVLRQVFEAIEGIGRERDEKLRTFKEFLLARPTGKVLVFSSFKDTTRYLRDALREDPRFHGLSFRTLDSDDDAKTRDGVLGRFAPRSNDAPEIAGTAEEIRVLISTDVISEGQNLQDCPVVVNYDLHWNPIRMVQRAGRVDRMGSEHEYVEVHNFYPEEGLERLLGLVERLQEKIEEINRLGLADMSVMGEAIDPRVFNAVRRIYRGEMSIWEELEAESELLGNDFMRQALDAFLARHGRDALERLPDGIWSGKRHERAKGVFFYLRVRARGDRPAEDFWYFVDLAEDRIVENRLHIAHVVASQEETPREVSLTPDAIAAAREKAVAHLLRSVAYRDAALEAPPMIEQVQRDSIALVEALAARSDVSTAEIDEILGYLHQPRGKGTVKRLAELSEEYRKARDASTYLRALLDLARRAGEASAAPPSEAGGGVTREDIDEICSMVVG